MPTVSSLFYPYAAKIWLEHWFWCYFIAMTTDQCASPLIEGIPTACRECAGDLCLRQQVLNMALGFTESLLCLHCLAKENGKEPDEMLGDLKVYIYSRECFKSQWIKYLDESYCPSPKGCYPSVCFEEI